MVELSTEGSSGIPSKHTPKQKKSPARLRSLLGARRPGSSSYKDYNSGSYTTIDGITTFGSHSVPTTPTNVVLSDDSSSEEEMFFPDEYCGPDEGSLPADPTLHDSASMVAFSLSTPTKHDPHDFHHAFIQSYDSDDTASD
jgi:hypothetical protein